MHNIYEMIRVRETRGNGGSWGWWNLFSVLFSLVASSSLKASPGMYLVAAQESCFPSISWRTKVRTGGLSHPRLWKPWWESADASAFHTPTPLLTPASDPLKEKVLTWGSSDSTAVALGPLQVHEQLLGTVLADGGSLLLLATKVQGSSGPPDDLFWDVAARQTHLLLQGRAS